MKQKVAMITGANRGIGFEWVKQLCQKGWKVYLGARTQEKAQEAASKILGAIPLSIDVTDAASVRHAVQEVQSKESYLDLLVNNAGVLIDRKNSLEVSMETVRLTWESNVLGAWQVAQAFSPLLTKGSQLINVSSEMSSLETMDSYSSAYRVSKTALNAVTRVLHADLHPKGVIVNSVCPGWVRTDMGGKKAPLEVEESVRRLVEFVLKEDKSSGEFFQHGKKQRW